MYTKLTVNIQFPHKSKSKIIRICTAQNLINYNRNFIGYEKNREQFFLSLYLQTLTVLCYR